MKNNKEKTKVNKLKGELPNGITLTDKGFTITTPVKGIKDAFQIDFYISDRVNNAV